MPSLNLPEEAPPSAPLGGPSSNDPGAEQRADEATSKKLVSATIRVILVVGALGWLLLSAAYLRRGAHHLLVVSSSTSLLQALFWLVASRTSHHKLALQLGIGSSLVAVITIAMLTGQGDAPAISAIILVPILASIATSSNSTLLWTLVALLATAGLHIARQLAPIEATYFARPLQRGVQQTLIVASAGGVIYMLRVLYEHQLEALKRREKKLLDLSSKLTSRSAELEQARDRALDATRAKSAFLANMSHELRTPLNAVIGMASLLEGEHLTSSQREQVNLIRTSSDALLGLISDILDLSKIEAGKLELSVAPFELARCIEDALDLVAPQAQAKGLELSYQLTSAVPRAIDSDFGRLRQVLVNLLANAVKFTSEGEVTLTVSARELDQRDHELMFEVRDTGIGIPPDRIGKLFRSFEQGDSSMTREFGGSGLGLAISKALVEKMGGYVGVESTVGEGSTFRFTIRAPERDVGEPRSGVFSIVDMFDRKIMVLDDSETIRAQLARNIERWGARPLLASSETEARSLLENDRPDLCFLDANLGHVDGLEVAERLHALPRGAELPIVLLTPLGYRERLASDERAQRMVDDHTVGLLTKPLKPSKVSDLARRALSGPVTPTNMQRRPGHQTSGKLRVLVAEDNATNQRVMARMLERLGHDAVFVANGQEALDKLEKHSFDVVLLDVQMPVLDGLETARRIVATHPRRARPRLIAVTASALAGDRERCLAAGMDTYLSKPIDIGSLAAQLGGVVPTPRARPSSFSTLDPRAIESLKLLGEQLDAPVLNETIEAFLDELPRHIASLRSALAEGDLTTLARHAHTLKGASSTAGALELSTTADELEQRCRAGDTASACAVFERLDRAVVSSSQALRELLQRTRPLQGAKKA